VCSAGPSGTSQCGQSLNERIQSVDEYIATPPRRRAGDPAARPHTIRKALPGAEEAISYQIPTYKLHGGYVVYFAGGSSTTRSIRHRRPRRGIQKGPRTVRGQQGHDPLPVPAVRELIERIAKFLAKEAAETGEGEASEAEEAQVTRRTATRSGTS